MYRTRLSEKKANMVGITKDIQNYFSQLIEPLVTNDNLNTMFEKFKTDVLQKLEKRITDQDNKIEELESRLLIQKNVIDKLLLQSDDNEQYSRRSCLRINGMEFEDNEKSTDVMAKLEECYNHVELAFDANDIERVHRIGNVFTDKDTGKKTKQIIVKFKSWGSRAKFYRARPQMYKDGVLKPGPKLFNVQVDLTKQRHQLLSDAKGKIKHYKEIKFAFANINCSLGIMLNDKSFYFFNDQQQLDNILKDLDYTEDIDA